VSVEQLLHVVAEFKKNPAEHVIVPESVNLVELHVLPYAVHALHILFNKTYPSVHPSTVVADEHLVTPVTSLVHITQVDDYPLTVKKYPALQTKAFAVPVSN